MRRQEIVAVVMLALLLGAMPVAASSGDYPMLFRTSEVRSENLKPFPKWTGRLERYFDERALDEGQCVGSEFNRCYYQEWAAFLATLAGVDTMARIDAVNRYMNQAPYISDLKNWGVKDYWETPGQFLRMFGDCEDYAIAKFLSLRILGFDNSRLRIVVLQDLNIKTPHAVLAVYLGGAPLILDNQIAQVVPSNEIYHYHPFYSVNENAWWLHKPE